MNLGRLRRITGLVLALMAVAWICVLFVNAVDDTEASLVPGSPVMFLLSFLFCAVGSLHNAASFQILLSAQKGKAVPFPVVFELFFTGQIVRYLPGRFWGVVYQYNAAKETVGAGPLVRSNIDLMVLSTTAALLVSAALILAPIWSGIAVPGLLMVLFLIILVLFRNDYLLPVRKVSEKLLHEGSRIRSAIDGVSGRSLPAGKCLLLFIVTVSGWAFYILAWHFLLKSWAHTSGLDALQMCATYTVSWLAGYLALITPGGIGIRELVFLETAGFVSNRNELVLVSVIVRLWLMCVDVLLFLVFLGLGRFRAAKTKV
ncbi:MAG: hypothetical protein QUS11_01600 [Candidatus Fermentibacter sp.]|nr:hypothetical protein [Candidatus Fermentibacter sp.]